MGGAADSDRPGAAHLLRFGAALSLVVAIALVGVVVEQRSLKLSRELSLQTFRADHLERQANDLRLKIETLQTPQRLVELGAAERVSTSVGDRPSIRHSP